MNTNRHIASCSLAVALAAAPCAVPPPALARTVSVSGPRIMLSDLIALPAGVADTDLGAAPQPGQRQRLPRFRVERALGSDGEEIRLAASYDVITRGRSYSCDALKQLVSEQLTDGLRAGLRLVALGCPAGDGVVLPESNPEIRAELGTSARLAGQVPITLRLSAAGWPPRTLVLYGRIEGQLAVAVTTEDVRAGDAASSARVRFEQRDAEQLPSLALYSPRDLDGMQFARPMRAGTLITPSTLVPVPLVVKGDAVTIAVLLDGLRVTSRGVARQDGGRGETVPVMALSSGKLIKARVVGPHQVTVDL